MRPRWRFPQVLKVGNSELEVGLTSRGIPIRQAHVIRRLPSTIPEYERRPQAIDGVSMLRTIIPDRPDISSSSSPPTMLWGISVPLLILRNHFCVQMRRAVLFYLSPYPPAIDEIPICTSRELPRSGIKAHRCCSTSSQYLSDCQTITFLVGSTYISFSLCVNSCPCVENIAL